jgi:hypothetical protein
MSWVVADTSTGRLGSPAMFTIAFWTAAAERAAKTAAQAILLVIGQDALGFDLFNADLANVAGAALSGAIISVCSSIVSIPLSAGNSPSLVPAAEVEAAQS